jgi:hypothetical protein
VQPGPPPAALYPPPPPQALPSPYPAAPPNQLHQTATVRNLVNLKKHTWKLAPCAGDPTKLQITFVLDVVQKCRCALQAGRRS